MQVNNELEASVLSPSGCILKVINLSLDERLSARGVEGPISNGYADMVKTDVHANVNKGNYRYTKKEAPSCSNGDKIRLGDPRGPMGLENGGGHGTVLILTKGPLVDNPRITSVVKE